MSALTTRLASAWADPLRGDDGFDPLAELDEVLAPLGLSGADAGGAVTVTGADPVVPSPVRVGSAASIGLLAKSVAAAALHRDRGGPGQDVHVDLRASPHRLCPFYDRTWERLGGYPVASTLETGNVMGFAFFRCRDGRWVMPQNMYPGLRERAQDLLGVPLTKAAVTDAIARWDAPALELAAAEAGVVMPMVRSLPEMLAEPQYTDVLAGQPLVEVTKIADGPPEPLPPLGAQPFSGLRALGMGHVIAGAGLGRSLALHGADVLNLWRPGESEHETTYASANVGMRSAWLDPRRDRAELSELLAVADVFFHNRRPAFLDEIGLTPGKAAVERPGIVGVSVSLHGLTGPWAGRPGFDQSAGSVTGMMLLEGGGTEPRLPPILVVNDYIVPWLAQAGVVAALRRRASEGGSYHVHVSLTRVALWILSLGILDREWAHATAGSDERHRYLDPETFTADTGLGAYQGVTDQVHMSATPGRYDPVLVARGSSDRAWLPS
ncbi:carnitine dehydratase [Actinomycetospora sp. NBRC 106375]|uniref:CoA transferase n=1 Tax=Actinomycetospora sp. NBRC 106375 TaxID=3032207 RepID=UPI0024A3093B|nr:CoA transferase [Actinomycetospora sp. NBRC 106375]GLZ46860.1 carnitine dehydratase [Actinomycetospora sp. NBRC 106375]